MVPDRTHLLVAVVALLLVAGCVSSPGDPGPAADDGTTPTTEDDPSFPTAEPADRLEIHSSVDRNITVAMYENLSRPIPNTTAAIAAEPVTSVTYDPEPGEVIRVTEFELDGWVVVSMGGRVIWNETIYSSDSYEISIGPNGNVEVLSHSQYRLRPR